MIAVQTVTEYGGEQGDGRSVRRIHFLSQVDDNRCESVDVLALQVEQFDSRSINADGVFIQFQRDIADITAVEPG